VFDGVVRFDATHDNPVVIVSPIVNEIDPPEHGALAVKSPLVRPEEELNVIEQVPPTAGLPNAFEVVIANTCINGITAENTLS